MGVSMISHTKLHLALEVNRLNVQRLLHPLVLSASARMQKSYGSPFYTAGHFWIHQKFNSPNHSGSGTFTIVVVAYSYRDKPSVEDDGCVRQFLTKGLS